MSKKYCECPLYNHESCREVDNPKLCALVREDKTCLRELQKTRNQARTKRSILLGKKAPELMHLA